MSFGDSRKFPETFAEALDQSQLGPVDIAITHIATHHTTWRSDDLFMH